jgi:hypothetical protein
MWIARIGFVGRGVVFLILGGLAVAAALNGSTRPVGTGGALNAVVSEPAGSLLALIITLCLLCFAALRAIEAGDDVYDYGDDLHGIARRTALGLAGVFYAVIGFAGMSIVLAGHYAPDNDQTVRDWTAWALGIPLGRWLVGLAGAVIVSIGLGLAAAGLARNFKRRLRLREKGSTLVAVLGAIGFLARSVVFVMIGAFLIFAAIHARPDEAQGFGGALNALRSQPYGNILLFAAAAGLVAFGIFGVAEAYYGRAARPDGAI